MQMKLVVTAGASKSGEITINPPMTLGRSRDADLTLRHALISRKHCEIVESQGAIIVRDLGSLNGTYVGGQRINEAALTAGDELTVGSVTFRVEMIAPDAPAAQAKAPQAAATGPIPQGVDPETGLQFLEPVDAIETVPVEQVEVAQETTPQAAAVEVSAVGTLERTDDETIQQPEAIQLEIAEPAEDSVPDIPLDLGDDDAQPAATSQIDFAPADEDAPSVVNPSDVAFEVADDQTPPDPDDSALGSFLKKL